METPEQERRRERAEKQGAFIDGYNLYIATNLRRANDLIRFADRFEKDRPSPIRDDILRAAVVFLHATLEDFLRYIGSPVAADLDKRTFGKTGRISEFLESEGIPTNGVKKFYQSLGELIARRHQIVHKGDLTTKIDQEGERVPRAIDASKVTEWYEAVISFTAEVAKHVLEGV